MVDYHNDRQDPSLRLPEELTSTVQALGLSLS